MHNEKLVKFEESTQTVQYSKTTGGDSFRRECYTQLMKIKGKPKTAVKTEIIKFNRILQVSPQFFEKLQPNLTLWQKYAKSDDEEYTYEKIAIPNDAAPQWDAFLKNIFIGKSMHRWLRGKKGSGPCVSFYAEYNPESSLGQALNQAIAFPETVINGLTYKAIPIGVGYYYGAKNHDRTSDYKSGEVFPINKTALEHTCKSTGHIANLEIKFSWVKCEQQEGCLKKADFFYGQYPAQQFIINLHIKSHKDSTITNENTFQQAIIDDHITSFANNIRDQFGPQYAGTISASTLWGNVISQRSRQPINQSDKKQTLEAPNPETTINLAHWSP